MTAVLELTLPIFALVFCGYAGRRLGTISDATVEGINQFVFFFALPAMLFRVAATSPLETLLDPRFAAAWLVAGVATYGITYWVGRRALGADSAQSAAWSLNASHGNVGYMGLPLASELGGAKALAPFLTAVIIDVFVLITTTIALLELARQNARSDAGNGPVAASGSRRPADAGARLLAVVNVIRVALRGLVRSPLVVAIAAGLAWSATGVKMPTVLDSFTRLLGGAAGPAALFAIGASLGGRAVAAGRAVGALTTIKLAVHPALAALAMLVLVPVAPYPAAIGVLAAALPSASNGFIIAQRYGTDVRTIGSSVVLSTFVAAATVSLTIWALGLR